MSTLTEALVRDADQRAGQSEPSSGGFELLVEDKCEQNQEYQNANQLECPLSTFDGNRPNSATNTTNNSNSNSNNHNSNSIKQHQTSIQNNTNATATTTTITNMSNQQANMHVCRLCDKLLSSSSSLDRHMLTHSGERPFVCKRCHMTFTTNGNMHRHMRTHLHKDSLARQQQEQQQLKSMAAAAAANSGAFGNPLGSLGFADCVGSPASHLAATSRLAMQLSGRASSQPTADEPTPLQTAATQLQLPISFASSLAAAAAAAAASSSSPLATPLSTSASIPTTSTTTAETSSSSSSLLNPLAFEPSQSLLGKQLTAAIGPPSLLMAPPPSDGALSFPNQHAASNSPSSNSAENHFNTNLFPAPAELASKLLAMGAGGHLGDFAPDLESMRAVVLAAAAAAAAVSQSQQSAGLFGQPMGPGTESMAGSMHSSLDQEQGLEQQQGENKPDWLSHHHNHQLETQPQTQASQLDADQRQRGKRRKQCNPRIHHRKQVSLPQELDQIEREEDYATIVDQEARVMATSGSAASSLSSAVSLASERLANSADESNEDEHDQDRYHLAHQSHQAHAPVSILRDVDVNSNEVVVSQNESFNELEDKQPKEIEEEDLNNNNTTHGQQTSPTDILNEVDMSHLQPNRSRNLQQQHHHINLNLNEDNEVEDPLQLEMDDIDGSNSHHSSSSSPSSLSSSSNPNSLGSNRNFQSQSISAADSKLSNTSSSSTRGSQNGNSNRDSNDVTSRGHSSDDHDDNEANDDDDNEHDNDDTSSTSNPREPEDELDIDIDIEMVMDDVDDDADDGDDDDELELNVDTNTNQDELGTSFTSEQLKLKPNETTTTTSVVAPVKAPKSAKSTGKNPKRQPSSGSIASGPIGPLMGLNGEIIEDISQSYVKTANPHAARKGGKRNRHCYKCKLCTYSSVDRCTLVRHLRIHSGERPYICGICRYAFTTKANCERHVRKRHKRQYNSLGGSGGVKGSNEGGRSLIITDHSNHQTIPVKVDPEAAQTISQTLQKIQDKQFVMGDTGSDMNLDKEEPHKLIKFADGATRIDTNQLNDPMAPNVGPKLGGKASKRKHLMDKMSQNSCVPYQRRRMSDKLARMRHDTLTGSQSDAFFTSGQSQTSSKNNNLLDLASFNNNNNHNVMHQSSQFGHDLASMQQHKSNDISSTSDLLASIMSQIQQQVTSNNNNSTNINNSDHHHHHQRSSNLNSNHDEDDNQPIISCAESQTADLLTQISKANSPTGSNFSATFLANMLASRKSNTTGNSAVLGDQTSHLLSPESMLLSRKRLTQQLTQLRGLNPQFTFDAVDLAVQALDLSCKYHSSRNNIQ